MTAQKKSFPGIFVIIIISFAVYLTVVTGVILFHYSKPKTNKDPKKLEVSCGHVKNFAKLPAVNFGVTAIQPTDSVA